MADYEAAFCRLSELDSHESIGMIRPAGYMGGHCPMHMVLSGLRQLEGIASIVVGTAECTNYSRFVLQDNPNHALYMLDEDEVVFGCREGLMNALEIMEERGIKRLLLIMTCIPSLTGEDMEALIHEWEETHRMQVGYVDVAHFKYKGFAVGKSLLLEQLVKWQMLEAISDNEEGKNRCQPKESSYDEPLIQTAIYAPHENGLALAAELSTYGCQVVFIHLEHFDTSYKADQEQLLMVADPYIGYINHEEAFIKWCKQQSVELIVSYYPEAHFSQEGIQSMNYLDWRGKSDDHRRDIIKETLTRVRKERNR